MIGEMLQGPRTFRPIEMRHLRGKCDLGEALSEFVQTELLFVCVEMQ